MDVCTNSLDKLEEFHIHAAKNVQNLPDAAANPACLATLGWSPISSLIDMMRLMFLWRMLLLPMNNIYKVLLIKKLICIVSKENCKASGPVCNIVSICKKYDVLDYVVNAVTTGEYITISEWKRKVKLRIQMLEVKHWKVSCNLYKSLLYVNKSISKFNMSPWWHHAHLDLNDIFKCRLIIQLLIGRNRKVKGLCSHCPLYVDNSVEHILFECGYLDTIRTKLWKEVGKCCLPNLFRDMNSLSKSERTKLVLNGFNICYVKEWKTLYHCIADFVYNLFKLYEHDDLP